jgi:phosphatidylethanolamine-binding protein (PEBP) family uncharacterized protein
VLLVAALLLAGCGGGSSDSDSSSTTSASSSASAGQQSSASAPSGEARSAPGVSAKPSAASGDGAAAAAGNGSQGQGGGGSQKQGSRIAAPKGPKEQAPSAEQVQSATVADMRLQSPAILAANGSPGHLPATYTCDGKDTWPQLKWQGTPPGTEELILYAMSVQPVQEQLFVDWAVAGLDPGLEGIQAGQLPKGAVVGTNGFGKRGYEICPQGAGEIYMFALYALPRALSPQAGFDARELRKAVLDASGNVGLLPAVYARG